jgi:hypothetical protein
MKMLIFEGAFAACAAAVAAPAGTAHSAQVAAAMPVTDISRTSLMQVLPHVRSMHCDATTGQMAAPRFVNRTLRVR